MFLFLNGPSSASASFSSFKTNITILTRNKCEKCQSSIWCWDSNPHPLKLVSPPITTRPGLPPSRCFLYSDLQVKSNVFLLNKYLLRDTLDVVLPNDKIYHISLSSNYGTWSHFKNLTTLFVDLLLRQRRHCLLDKGLSVSHARLCQLRGGPAGRRPMLPKQIRLQRSYR